MSPDATKIEAKWDEGSFIQLTGALRKYKQPLDWRAPYPCDGDGEMGVGSTNDFLQDEALIVS